MNDHTNSDQNQQIRITRNPLSPNSKKVYVPGQRFADLRIPFREVTLTAPPPNSGNGNGNGHKPANETILLYDTSGPYTDPKMKIDVRQGLDPIRAEWIRGRGDVEAYGGREIRPEDNGFRSDARIEESRRFDRSDRKVLRARPGANVSQMHYAKKGIITPEMEYIAIRETMRRGEIQENAERENRL
ncbi:MAG: phosphomethylpyrimidine synthase ThiC, partial [Nitrospinae bacterium CG11_big_fil_rev_8_21_14_0_20_56_8]